MSSATIVVLVLAGIVALLFIGYINHMLEKSKLDRARRRAELVDRYRRCAALSEGLPGQLITPELKQLLNRLELHALDELVSIDRNEPKYPLRAEELRQCISKGDELPVNNPPLQITTDAQVKDVRFQLESLQAQIIRGAEEKALPVEHAKQWLAQVKHMLVHLYIEYFNNIGRQLLGQKRPGQARLAFERAVQYLKKQKDPTPYQQHLKQFQELFEHANALLLEQTNAKKNGTSELTEGLELQSFDEEWKKKQIYD